MNQKGHQSNQIAQQEVQGTEKKYKFILDSQPLTQLYEGKLNEIKNQLEEIQQSFSSNINVENDYIQKCIQLMKEISEQLVIVMEKFTNLEKCNSQQENHPKTKISQTHQTQQNNGDKDPLQSQDFKITSNQSNLFQSDPYQQKISNKQEKQAFYQQVEQKPKKKDCLINHSHNLINLQNYQPIFDWLLQYNVKNYKKCVKCLCDETIKISELTSLSNKHLFDFILNQQQESIFENLCKKQKILKCKNLFCSFKCIYNGQVNNQDVRVQKFYCTICDEYSMD